MQIHTLHPHTRRRPSHRVGRGGKRGTYSGRGIKGLGARAGGKFRAEERDVIKKIPKLRGYRFRSVGRKRAVVNADALAAAFKDGETVSPATLLERGLVRRVGGKIPAVKILGRGEIKKRLVYKDVLFSAAASLKIPR